VRPGGTPRDAVAVLILGGLSAFGPLSTDLYLPGLPALTRDLGASASTGQLTLTTCLLGMAAGQLLGGPVSDVLGRRPPLLAGLCAYVAASVACALAPSIGLLVALRFLQGCAGGVGIVIATAVVRDLYDVAAGTRIFALLLLISGAAPIIAPTLGAEVLRYTSWHGVFVLLAGIGGALLVLTTVGLRESLPPERRHERGLAVGARTFGRLLGDRSFAPHAATVGLAFAAAFAYIAASPFVLEDIHGMSPQLFGALFAVNAGSFVVTAQLSGHLVRRVGPGPLLTAGVTAAGVAGAWVLVAVVTHAAVAVLLVGLALLMAGNGLVMPNATALALAGQGRAAGSAAALLGLGRFGFAAAIAPLVGVAGPRSALPMGIVIATFALSAVAVHLAFGRRER
jgi:DHA1 family bicyclomycin/chloramphenicol resistance-like MFS transporter